MPVEKGVLGKTKQNIVGNESFTHTEKFKKRENTSRARDVIKNCN